jgi:dTDP-4-dehydrorhamnose 3,5-epimerase
MKRIETGIADLIEIEPRVFEDDRGYFFESYNKRSFEEIGIQANFVQDNQSLSHKGVLRGLHFQAPPFAQGKLVRVINGSVLDVAVDIRKNSPTYGKHHVVLLSGSNKKMLWIPEGFAHGFCTLEDHTIFAYKCTETYNKESEGCLLWNDAHLQIDWILDSPVLSDKDKQGMAFVEFNSPF